MSEREQIEKVRQEIMRFRELLNIMHLNLEQGDRAYAAMFSGLSAEAMQNVKEKDLQWKLAEELAGDTSQLAKAVLQMRLGSRELERAFEELYNIIVTIGET